MSFAYLFKSLSVRKNEDDNNYMVTTPIKTYGIIYACIQVSRHYKFQNTTYLASNVFLGNRLTF